jgi:purine-binding chemotaxis protein CheW
MKPFEETTLTIPDQALTCRVGNSHFAIDVARLQEIVADPVITPLPSTSPAVRGVLYLRNTALVVLDLSYLVQRTAHAGPTGSVAVIQSQGRRIGLLLEGVDQVIPVSPDQREELDDALPAASSAFLDCLIKTDRNILTLINCDPLLETLDDATFPTEQTTTDGAASGTVDVRQLITFMLDGMLMGVAIEEVHEIIVPPDIFPVPGAPPYVRGIINLRGDMVPVISLRARLSLPEKISNRETRIVVVDILGMRIGLIVDAVRHVVRLAGSELQPPPKRLLDETISLIRGFGRIDQSPLIWIDLAPVIHGASADDEKILRELSESRQDLPSSLQESSS